MKIYYYHKTDLDMGHYNLFDKNNPTVTPPVGQYVRLDEIKALFKEMKINITELNKRIDKVLLEQ